MNNRRYMNVVCRKIGDSHFVDSVTNRFRGVALVALMAIAAMECAAQSVLSLDSCRALAIANNKELLISGEKINAAHYQKKAAFTNFLPELSASGGYIRNQREISLLSDAQKSALGSMGTTVGTAIGQAGQSIAQLSPEMAQQLAPLFQAVQGQLVPTFDAVGQTLIDALRTDTRNVFAGAITLTQPLYMGGKIRAYNKITNYAEQLAQQQHNTGMQEVILSTDQVYWQVVSLVNKKKLAEGYLKLLQQMESDIEKMIKEGVATRADGLTVSVKLNEAEMTLTKVEDGLSLSRMLLCQLCGLDLQSDIVLADEQMENLPISEAAANADVDLAMANRPELRSLELATKIYQQKIRVTRASHLPSLALMGSLSASNPSVFNSFEKKFKGMWSVGVMVNVPIWHWGEGYYQVKAAKSEARIAQYQYEDAREKIELQVNQAAFKVKEAEKKLVMAEKNREKADENLRTANLGFREGVIPTNNLLEAQTAWLSAQSDRIDAQIDVKLTDIYLKKALGTLSK